MIENPIFAKIQKLRENPELDKSQQERLIAIEKKANKLIGKKSLLLNPLFKQREEELQKKVEQLNHQLTTQREMTEQVRALIFEKLDWYKQEMEIFADVDQKLEEIEKQVESWTNNLK